MSSKAWFVAPFGRDRLVVSLQKNMLIYPEFARGSLEMLGSLQAQEDDPYRDAEPGKIPHELRYGELAHFKLIRHTPDYGTADATPLYLITLNAAWRAMAIESCGNGIYRRLKGVSPGSTNTVTGTVTDFTNIRPGPGWVTKTWAGRILAMQSRILTSHCKGA
jgi:glycogen debranching enzyme